MTRADLWGGLLLALFFGVTLWEGSTFQYGTEFSPGPGFAPVWLSAVGLCIALLIAAHGLRLQLYHRAEEKVRPPSLERHGVVRIVMTLIGLTAMIFLIPPLGLVLAVLAFLLFLTLIVQRLSFVVGIGASVLTVVFIWFVFEHFLEVPVPQGPLGF